MAVSWSVSIAMRIARLPIPRAFRDGLPSAMSELPREFLLDALGTGHKYRWISWPRFAFHDGNQVVGHTLGNIEHLADTGHHTHSPDGRR
jgi:hypothetical protein